MNTPYNTGKVKIGAGIQPQPARMPRIEGDSARLQTALLKPMPAPHSVDPLDVVTIICAVILPIFLAALAFGAFE